MRAERLQVADAGAVWKAGRTAESAAIMRLSERWANPSLEAVAAIEQGLPFSALDDIEDVLPDTLRRIVPRSTLAAQKKKGDTLTPA